MAGFRADYSYKMHDGVLVIIDKNLGGKSVTNDMENVLAEIKSQMFAGGLPKLIIYRDSEGTYDQTYLENEVAQFKPLAKWPGCSEIGEAVRLVREINKPAEVQNAN